MIGYIEAHKHRDKQRNKQYDCHNVQLFLDSLEGQEDFFIGHGA